jgi:carbonic anhydrase/acetyltransferase-like protein (isoleucine patch superfamily)
MGHPGKLRRTLTPEELEGIDAYAARYVEYAQTYRDEASTSEKGTAQSSRDRAAKS